VGWIAEFVMSDCYAVGCRFISWQGLKIKWCAVKEFVNIINVCVDATELVQLLRRTLASSR